MTAPLAELIVRFTALEHSSALVAARLLVIALTVVLLLIAYQVVVGLIRRLPLLRPGTDVVRVRTLASLLTSVARWAVGFVVVVIALRELGVDVGAIVVSAGVLGIGIGLGAQSLIRDVITGMFLLFEDLIHVGDVVQIGSYTGTVESTGLRVATVRLDDGALRVVPNGQLTEFANYSLGGARAMVDVPVAREVPVAQALAVLTEVGAAWAGEAASCAGPAAKRTVSLDGAAATCCCDSRHASPPSDARPSSTSCGAASRKHSTGSTGPRSAPPDRSPP